MPAWEELKAIAEELSERKDVRVIVLSGEGKLFCAGIDLDLLMSVNEMEKIPSKKDREEALYAMVIKLQGCVSALEMCTKPVIAAIHGGCIGGGVDIIAACDLRYCSDDAYFIIKEIDMGMVADLGTLQRLPRFVNPAVVTEMALTGCSSVTRASPALAGAASLSQVRFTGAPCTSQRPPQAMIAGSVSGFVPLK